jgi:hypothetical protein
MKRFLVLAIVSLAVLCVCSLAFAGSVSTETGLLTKTQGGISESWVSGAVGNNTEIILPTNVFTFDHSITVDVNATLASGSWTVYAYTKGGHWAPVTGGTISATTLAPISITNLSTTKFKLVPANLSANCTTNATARSK